jgi:type IV pilus assembly protein PilF
LIRTLVLFLWSGPGCSGHATAEAAERAQRKYEVAVGLYQAGDQPGALRSLYDAVELDPSHFDSELLMGNIFLLREDFRRAEEHFVRAGEIRPDSHEAKNSLAVLRIHQRRHDEAIRLLRSLTEDPLTQEVHLAWGNLGWAYLEKGALDDAISALRHAVQEQPLFCVGHYRLGDAYYRKEDWAAAEQSLARAVTTDAPGCVQLQDAHRLLGLSRVRLDKPTEAAEAFRACRTIDAESEEGVECATYLRGLQ